MDLREYVDKAEQFESMKADYVRSTGSMEFDNQARMIISPELFGDIPPMQVNDWSWVQLFSKLGPSIFGKGSGKSLPGEYLLNIPKDLLATNVNRCMDGVDKSYLIRTYNGNVRAILDDSYPKVPNIDLIKAVDMLYEAERDSFPGFKVARASFFDEDTLHLKTLWAHTNNGGYGMGVYIGNSEIGKGKIKVLPLVQRHSCENSIITQVGGVEIVHRGKIESMMVHLKAVIGELFNSSSDIIDRMILAEAQNLPSLADCIRGLRQREGWNDEFIQNVVMGTENQHTVAGLINGITYAAHQPGVSPDEQIKLEIGAGELLFSAAEEFQALARLGTKVREEVGATFF